MLVGRALVVIPRGGMGGAQLAALEVAEGARRAGWHVEVATGPGGSLPWDGPLHLLPAVERRADRLPGAVRALRRVHATARPDVVHNHGVGLGLAVSLATGRGRWTPALTTVHGLPQHDLRGAARALRLAGLPVTAVAPGLAAALEAAGAPPVVTIANAVGPAPAPADRAALLGGWGLPTSTRLVVTLGRLVDDKRPVAVVRALPALAHDVVAVFVGDGPLREVLLAEADRLGVARRVRVTGWRGDARALLGAADVAVQPSRWEGLARVVLEAWSAGVPLVAARGPAFSELVRDGVDGVLVDVDPPAALAEGVARVLDQPAWAAGLAAAGRARVAEFDPERMLASYLALYRRLITRQA